MNNDLEQFSEERLMEIAMDAYEADFSCDEIEALARIALSAKQAKPVGYLFVTPEGAIAHSISNVGIEGFKFIGEVYDAPPLNHTEQHMVVPDGWKLVPIEPTDAMQVAAANAIRFDTTAINKLWTGKRVFDAMLAAAPKPESER